MTGVLAAWVVELGVITYRDFKGGRLLNGLPIPADFLATFVIFGALGLLGAGDNPNRRNFATATAWGFVVATLVQAIDPAKPLPTTGALASLTGSKSTKPSGPSNPTNVKRRGNKVGTGTPAP